MRRGKQDFAFVCEDTFPFLFSIIKQPLNFLFQLIVSISIVTELQINCGVIGADQLIIQFSKNQFEDFLK